MPTLITPNLVSSPAIRANSISDEAGTGSPSFPNGLNIAGPNRSADGTVSVPSIAFINSTTTGLFRKAADSVGFSAAGVEIGFYANTGAWTFGPATGGGPINHLFRSGLNTTLDVRSANGSITRIALSDGVNNDIYLRRNSGASASFDILSDATVLATSTSAGAWTFGATSAAVDHQFNGARLKLTRASGVAEIEANGGPGAAGRLLLNRGISIDSEIYFGAGCSFITNLAISSISSGFVSSPGAWTFGPTSAGATLEHTLNGHLRIGTSAASVVPNSTSVRIVGNRKSSIVFTDSSSTPFMELLGGTYTTNSSQYFKTIAGNAGGRFLVIAQSAATANVFNFDITGIAGAADSADGFATVGGIAQNGAWTLGPTGGATSHTVNGSVTLSTVYNRGSISNTFSNFVDISGFSGAYLIMASGQENNVNRSTVLLLLSRESSAGSAQLTEVSRSFFGNGFGHMFFQISGNFIQIRNNAGLLAGSTCNLNFIRLP